MIKVNEIFGPTIQGEGPAAGRHCLFVRVANCNLECTWCDTAYTWAFNQGKAEKTESKIVYDKSENLKEMFSGEIFLELSKLWPIVASPTIIVVSGGEPMMQQGELVSLFAELKSWGNQCHVETAGTILPTSLFDYHVEQYTVSPKLEHSGNVLNKRYKPEALRFFALSNKAWFKYVLRSPSDFVEVDYQVKECGIRPQRVMVMPEGTTSQKNMDIAKTLVDGALERGFGLSYRTHVLLWEDARAK